MKCEAAFILRALATKLGSEHVINAVFPRIYRKRMLGSSLQSD
jgi:hypothetical protein